MQINADEAYTGAGQSAGKARNQRDEARAKHFEQHFRAMRDSEKPENREHVSKLFAAAYETERARPVVFI
ncbi:MAG: hypothetical protein KJZ90_00135 [Rhodocyclaceae bacterium]|nr:hypothetical protein [Rhodocyclaceae bacterium]